MINEPEKISSGEHLVIMVQYQITQLNWSNFRGVDILGLRLNSSYALGSPAQHEMSYLLVLNNKYTTTKFQ